MHKNIKLQMFLIATFLPLYTQIISNSNSNKNRPFVKT